MLGVANAAAAASLHWGLLLLPLWLILPLHQQQQQQQLLPEAKFRRQLKRGLHSPDGFKIMKSKMDKICIRPSVCQLELEHLVGTSYKPEHMNI